MVAPITAEEALRRLTSEERRAVEEFRAQLRARYGARLRDLRLFGSRARGEAHEESDLDILVLLDGTDLATLTAIVELAMSISPWLSPHVFDFDCYHAPVSRATGFYRELRKESVRL
jgi:predicted nucleotidyltransferase